MYRELLTDLIKDCAWAKLQEPCPEEKIAEAEKCVGFTFPEELKALLRETNGDHWLLLSADGIIRNAKENRAAFSEYLEPDVLEEKVNRHIFFATNGCGDYYCYRILPNGEADTSAIYLWEHELLETRTVAADITDLIIKYYHDEI